MSGGVVVDRWHLKRRGPNGERLRTSRYGTGLQWQARWRDALGVQQSRAFPRKVEADAFLTQLRADRAAGKAVDRRAGAVTLQDYVAAWLPRQVHRGDSSDRASRARLKAVCRYLGPLPLRDLTHEHVQDLVAALLAQPLAPATVRACHAQLKAVLADAVRSRVVPVNVAAGVRLPRVPTTRVVPLTAAQLAALHEAMPAHLRPVLLLGACTGMRLSELLGLTWDRVRGDVVWLDRQLDCGSRAGVPSWGPLKVPGTERDVTLPAWVVDVLEAHRAASAPNPWGMVFTNQQGRFLRQEQARRGWVDAVERAGLASQLQPGQRWHALRHYHASVLVSDGLSVRYVADRLGHKNVKETLDTYSHLMPRDEDRARARLEALAGDLPGAARPALSLVATG